MHGNNTGPMRNIHRLVAVGRHDPAQTAASATLTLTESSCIQADSRSQLLICFLVNGTIEHVNVSVGRDLESLSDEQVVAGMRELLAVQHEAEVQLVALVDQVARRGLAQTYGCKNVVQLLRQTFNLGAAEAAAKVRLAAAVSPRRTLTGQVLPAVHEQTAQAFTAGEVSSRSADIVTRTVDRLPDCVLDEAHPAVESVLLDFARSHDPDTLARHATRIVTALDQDGALRDAEHAARRRTADLTRGSRTGRASSPRS